MSSLKACLRYFYYFVYFLCQWLCTPLIIMNCCSQASWICYPGSNHLHSNHSKVFTSSLKFFRGILEINYFVCYQGRETDQAIYKIQVDEINLPQLASRQDYIYLLGFYVIISFPSLIRYRLSSSKVLPSTLITKHKVQKNVL